ncbi:hypothetical protein QWY93_03120 [Echinicola jeungdonensis]|uniref:Uncharacterized protein n=1 Tax=Echinicola jeungdonensis TaxID=709343 RepID=A0ABV5J2N0_9BACT|nr:hypothetical protein [Echinicola jeungdonensis]MDN3668319.1 hypothetical protein [Echinicola jeungdonensis]
MLSLIGFVILMLIGATGYHIGEESNKNTYRTSLRVRPTSTLY